MTRYPVNIPQLTKSSVPYTKVCTGPGKSTWKAGSLTEQQLNSCKKYQKGTESSVSSQQIALPAQPVLPAQSVIVSPPATKAKTKQQQQSKPLTAYKQQNGFVQITGNDTNTKWISKKQFNNRKQKQESRSVDFINPMDQETMTTFDQNLSIKGTNPLFAHPLPTTTPITPITPITPTPTPQPNVVVTPPKSSSSSSVSSMVSSAKQNLGKAGSSMVAGAGNLASSASKGAGRAVTTITTMTRGATKGATDAANILARGTSMITQKAFHEDNRGIVINFMLAFNLLFITLGLYPNVAMIVSALYGNTNASTKKLNRALYWAEAGVLVSMIPYIFGHYFEEKGIDRNNLYLIANSVGMIAFISVIHWNINNSVTSTILKSAYPYPLYKNTMPYYVAVILPIIFNLIILLATFYKMYKGN
jgi:hypothetical protein